MRAAIYLMATPPTGPGYVVVGTDAQGLSIVHAQPNAPVPLGAVVIKPNGQNSGWADLKVSHPALANYALRAIWKSGRKNPDGSDEIVSGPVASKKAQGKPPLGGQTDLPPHYWFGDT